MENIIEIKGLKKSFGDYEVLKNINLTVYKGESVGILGRNGEGKSTMMKMIAQQIDF